MVRVPYFRVLSDARRRQQTFQFLELLQHKSQSCYETFLEVLSEYEPHLYLLLTNWDQGKAKNLKHGLMKMEVRKIYYIFET